MQPSLRTILELNITRYRELLRTETDLTKRQTIVMLLAEEEAKLANLVSSQFENSAGALITAAPRAQRHDDSDRQALARQMGQ
jgi:hypothetical protein